MKRDKFDTVVSNLVRERADYTCERCGINSRHDTRQMQCSHFVTRGASKVLRYDMDNLVCLCATCHSEMERHPHRHTDFFRQLRGDGMTEILDEKQRERRWHDYKYQIEDMYQHYSDELKRLREKRKNGVVGWLNVENWF